MIRTRSWSRVVSVAAPLALLLGAVDAASACQVTTGDFDRNGLPDVRFKSPAGTRQVSITVEAGPDFTTVRGCARRDFSQGFSSYLFELKGQTRVVFNVAGTWAGLKRVLTFPYGLKGNRLTIGGTGSLTAGSSLLFQLDAMAGREEITLDIPAMDASYFDARFKLDPGADVVAVNVANPITGGSVVNVDAVLGGDANAFSLRQTGLVDGTVNMYVEGGVATDTGTLRLAGPVGPAGRLFLRADLGKGNDVFDGAADLGTFSVAAGGEVHLDVSGEGGDDVLLLGRVGTGGPAAIAGLLDVYFGGNLGADRVSVDLSNAGVQLDGTVRLRPDGGPGIDFVTAQVAVAASSATPSLDVLVRGGSGADQVALLVSDDGPGTAANYGPAQRAILDGGFDRDRCDQSPNVHIHARNCE